MTVAIPDSIRRAMYAHAREAFPDECCGYLLGENGARTVVRCQNAQAEGLHPTHPDRGADAGFVIAGRELFEFARAFGGGPTTGPGRPLVVYHSHTNGEAYLSRVDRLNALADGRPVYPVEHLVIGVTPEGITEAAQFAWSEAAGDFVEVARWDGRC